MADRLDEEEIIARFKAAFSVRHMSGVRGIGDDCAVIPLNRSQATLVTTDMLVEGTHFLVKDIFPKELGWKALAVNLSDIAAMGGNPQYAYLSLGIPRTASSEWISGFISGFSQLARKFHVELLGGDTVRSDLGIVVNVAVTGVAARKWIKYRNTAKVGDVICVTGPLGDSAAGLHAVSHGVKNVSLLRQKHFRPLPHILEGQWLTRQIGVSAMMDLSDGLDTDLRRMIKASSCGAAVNADKIPISPALRKYCQTTGIDQRVFTLAGGEDYCLLLTVSPKHIQKIQGDFNESFSRPLNVIGVMNSKKNKVDYTVGNKVPSLQVKSFEHF